METPKHLCQSCHCLVEEDAAFCSVCGQKKIHKTASMSELLGDAIANLFSLDSKFIRTFKALLFIPGKLTNAYFEGKRQLYYTPIRLFLFSVTFSFILLALINSNETNHSFSDKVKEIALQSYQDSIQQALYAVFPDSISQHKINQVIRPFPNNKVSKEDKPLLTIDTSDEVKKLPLNHDDPSLLNALNGVISGDDIYLLSPDEVVKKYQIEGFWKQLLIRQLIKANVQDTFEAYLYSHLSWLILISIPLLAFLLKLLYIRKKYLYVEHLVHLLHIHTLFAVVFSCWIIWFWLQADDYSPKTSILVAILAGVFYFLVSMKRVYKQSKRKTFFKIFLFSIGYVFVISFSFILFLFLVFLLF